LPSLPGVGYSEEIRILEERLEALRDLRPTSSSWKTIELARQQGRPQTLDYVEHLFEDFQELHGDRLHGDDPAVVGGIATLDGRTVMVIGHQKGHDLKERQFRNFGMPRPEGYRKAQRLVSLADKFNMPILSFIDTQGAFPGREAEEGGQAGAISRTLQAFARVSVPTVAVVLGEGGSGGALALALCDRVYMLENSIYSVITPEGCAAILWRDAAEAPQAAEALRLTASDLLSLGVIDGIITEPGKGAHKHHRAVAKRVEHQVLAALAELEAQSGAERREARRRRFLAMGSFVELSA
jgi:acetyl-CoA carboxylase carboxyl transferase subunit alpha